MGSHYTIENAGKIDFEQIRYSQAAAKSNRVWKITGTDLVLRESKDSGKAFERETERETGSRIALQNFEEGALKKMFRRFYESGELVSVRLLSDEEFEEIDELRRLLRLKEGERGEKQARQASELFEEIIESNELWHFSLRRKGDEKLANVYKSGAIHAQSANDALTLCMEALDAAGLAKKEGFEAIEFKLKTKASAPHPLRNASALLEALFKAAGKEEAEKLGIGEEEFAKIKEDAIARAESYKNATIEV